METDTSTTDHLLREREITNIIEREIALMPKGTREVFELSRKHYLSHKEIAERLEMSEEAVNKQIKRALRTLRVRLGLLAYIAMCLKYSAELRVKPLMDKANCPVEKRNAN